MLHIRDVFAKISRCLGDVRIKLPGLCDQANESLNSPKPRMASDERSNARSKQPYVHGPMRRQDALITGGRHHEEFVEKRGVRPSSLKESVHVRMPKQLRTLVVIQ